MCSTLYNKHHYKVFLLTPSLSPEANDEGEPEAEEQLLEMDEEAALIEAERILDDSDPKARDGRNSKKSEDILAELSEQMLAMNLHEAEEQPSQGQGQGQGQVDDEGWQVGIFWYFCILKL